MPVFNLLEFSSILPQVILLVSALLLLPCAAYCNINKARTLNIASMLALVFAALMQLLISNLLIYRDSAWFYNNGFTDFIKILVLVGSVFSLFLAAGYYRKNSRHYVAEYPILVLLAVAGLLFLVSAHNFLILYMALELTSLALYVLAAFNRNNIKSSEAGIKYFVLGALASSIMLYGISLIYGFTGTTNFSEIAKFIVAHNSVDSSTPVMLIVGLVLVIVGFCFKISAAPFHMWTPDVFEGAPLPVTAFFAAVPKVAALGALITILYHGFAAYRDSWQQVIAMASILSMLVGAFGGLRQVNLKRLMAYSSIGHIGYILLGVLAYSEDALRGVLFYLFIYITATLGIFAAIIIIKQREEASEDIYSFSGLAKNNPYLAIMVSIILLSMAGIPPFAGFFAKFFVLFAAVKAGFYPLVIFALLTSVVAAFYYLRIIKIMYFDEATNFDKDVPYEVKFILILAALFNLLFFIAFSPVLDSAKHAAKALF